MTEAEWETCTDAAAMLVAAARNRGPRKFRLLACACARSRWEGLAEEEFRVAIEIAEEFADGRTHRETLRHAADNIAALSDRATIEGDSLSNAAAEATVADFAGNAALQAVAALGGNAVGVVREIMGNPFRVQGVPVGADHDAVRILAQHCYAAQYFAHLPVLAEMLTESGCDDQPLLTHLRSPGPHYRGCWALDAILDDGAEQELITLTEWQQAVCPFEMLRWWWFYRGASTARKRRLLFCACCHLIAHLITDEPLLQAVAVAEAFADGFANKDELTQVHETARKYAESHELFSRVTTDASVRLRHEISGRAARAVAGASVPDDGRPPHFEIPCAVAQGYYLWRTDHEDAAQAALVRDVLGSPFGEPVIAATWWTADVLALARGIYDERAFDRLPILADALQDAGCEDEAILEHCRSEGPHVRGCWVVDLLLGKS